MSLCLIIYILWRAIICIYFWTAIGIRVRVFAHSPRAILETIELYVNKLLILNRIIHVRLQYLK